jgi:hypothetical protein
VRGPLLCCCSSLSLPFHCLPPLQHLLCTGAVRSHVSQCKTPCFEPRVFRVAMQPIKAVRARGIGKRHREEASQPLHYPIRGRDLQHQNPAAYDILNENITQCLVPLFPFCLFSIAPEELHIHHESLFTSLPTVRCSSSVIPRRPCNMLPTQRLCRHQPRFSTLQPSRGHCVNVLRDELDKRHS